MATFRQRSSGYWQAIVRRKGWPQQSQTFRTKSEAHSWARSVEAEIDKGTFQSSHEAERILFKELLSRFRSDFAEQHYRSRTDNKEAWRFQCDRLQDFFGPYSLAAIDQKLIARYRDERLSPPPSSKRKPVGQSTVRKEIYLLSKIFGYAEKEEGIRLPRGNPLDRVRKPSESASRDRRLSQPEFERLELQCRHSGNRFLFPAFQLAIETAMRQGELLDLTWENIDDARAIAMLPTTKNGEPRAVPLTTKALATLKSLPTRSGKVIPLGRQTLYQAFAAAVRRAEIEDFTWHDLRHEALSRLAERGDLSLLEMAEVSGHKTLQMLKRYTHLQAEKLAKKLNSRPTAAHGVLSDLDKATTDRLKTLAEESGLTESEILSAILNGQFEWVSADHRR